MNTNTTKQWTLSISKDTVFKICTDETLYQAYSRTASNPLGDAVVIQDDDYGYLDVYFKNAIANLQILLAKRLDSAPASWDDTVSFNLNMHDNHDDAIEKILERHCQEYVVKQILEQWYRADFGSELERLEIKHCLQYRKNPVRRRIGPLF